MKLCECGCGEEVGIAARTIERYGMVKGQPVRFRPGHHRRPNKPKYIVDEETGCWNWNWSLMTTGYGQSPGHGRSSLAHVQMYEKANGPVPEGLQLDHLCRNRRCVNPDHLEPVTQRVNSRRGAKTKLTEDQVREIRAIGRTMRQREIAAMFGTSRTNVSSILRGTRWSQLDTP